MNRPSAAKQRLVASDLSLWVFQHMRRRRILSANLRVLWASEALTYRKLRRMQLRAEKGE